MTIIVGVVSQKGGVGKSTVARLVAREFAVNKWLVKIGDLDISQGTSFDWLSRRLERGVEPDISVELFGRVDKALQQADQYDLLILDGAPHSTKQTKEVAHASDLIIIPTGVGLDDLKPAVKLGHELSAVVSSDKIAFIFIDANYTDKELHDAYGYIEAAGYSAFGELPKKSGYRLAANEGLAVTETRFKTLNNKADILAQSIVNRIAEVTSFEEEKHANMPACSKKHKKRRNKHG